MASRAHLNSDCGPSLPDELLLLIIALVPIPDLISLLHTTKILRALVPQALAGNPARKHLFSALFKPHTALVKVPLSTRLRYVQETEERHAITIPETYRTLLVEWPVPAPPACMCWPDAVQFFATGLCTCSDAPLGCSCAKSNVCEGTIYIDAQALDFIQRGEPFPSPQLPHLSGLFAYPPRLHTTQQNAKTRRVIRALPAESWTVPAVQPFQNSVFKYAVLRVLRLSRFWQKDRGSDIRAAFFMILSGPLRGEIHAWYRSVQYQGFEASGFFEWTYDTDQPKPPYALIVREKL